MLVHRIQLLKKIHLRAFEVDRLSQLAGSPGRWTWWQPWPTRAPPLLPATSTQSRSALPVSWAAGVRPRTLRDKKGPVMGYNPNLTPSARGLRSEIWWMRGLNETSVYGSDDVAHQRQFDGFKFSSLCPTSELEVELCRDFFFLQAPAVSCIGSFFCSDVCR